MTEEQKQKPFLPPLTEEPTQQKPVILNIPNTKHELRGYAIGFVVGTLSIAIVLGVLDLYGKLSFMC